MSTNVTETTEIFQPKKLYKRREIEEICDITTTLIVELEDANILPRVQISERNIRYLGKTLNQVFAEKFKTAV